jgi:hypothetical protein
MDFPEEKTGYSAASVVGEIQDLAAVVSEILDWAAVFLMKDFHPRVVTVGVLGPPHWSEIRRRVIPLPPK